MTRGESGHTPVEMKGPYRDKDEPEREVQMAAWHAWHFRFPALPQSEFNPSGLVPYPCEHGIPVKPKRFTVTKGGTAWFDTEGNEMPPFGAKSWGRAAYLHITSFGGRDGIPYATPQCVVCMGLPRPDDLTTPADE